MHNNHHFTGQNRLNIDKIFLMTPYLSNTPKNILYLSLEIEKSQGLQLNCRFRSQVMRQRTRQILQLLNSMSNPGLQPYNKKIHHLGP